MADSNLPTTGPLPSLDRPAPPGPPAPAAAPAVPTPKAKGVDVPQPSGPKDTVREVVETVVFVVVLVLLLKVFVAEAFVIPTGSMAETLFGYHKTVECPECKYVFEVNCSSEVDPQPGRVASPVAGCTCPNCQRHIEWLKQSPSGQLVVVNAPPSWSSGDRVLVLKPVYDDDHLGLPHRHDVVVFKFPQAPQLNQVAMNYIKRTVGLPGETVVIFNGDAYVTDSLTYPADKYPRPERREDLWQQPYMYENDERAIKLFNDSLRRAAEGKPQPGDFRKVQKSAAVQLAMRRLVNDNDFQPADLVAAGKPPRWYAADAALGAWAADNPREPRAFTHARRADDFAWLFYRHLSKLREGGADALTPQKITNTMGYNSGEPSNGPAQNSLVGDLMLEATVQVDAAEGQYLMELSRGVDRFQARFNLATGDCTLVRIARDKEGKETEKELATQPTKLKRTGEKYLVRFANFDGRLTVWVDKDLPFGDGQDYPPPADLSETDNDTKRPAGIAVQGGGVRVSGLQVWRDTYYTDPNQNPHDPSARPPRSYYVQPGHFLCLGDNSAESSDSRYWGLVPERLLLGRAMMVYYPLSRFGAIK